MAAGEARSWIGGAEEKARANELALACVRVASVEQPTELERRRRAAM